MGHTWDPDTDETAGEQCRAYGAPAVMRNPGRVHISWEDENTLRIHADEGNQVRLLHFNKAPPENILNNPKIVLLWPLNKFAKRSGFKPGTGIWAPSLYTRIATRTKRRRDFSSLNPPLFVGDCFAIRLLFY